MSADSGQDAYGPFGSRFNEKSLLSSAVLHTVARPYAGLDAGFSWAGGRPLYS